MSAVFKDLAPGLHFDIPAELYHADELCERPTLSCSLAKTIKNKSPQHAYYEHPRLGGTGKDEPTPEMETGSAIHVELLGRGGQLAICNEADWRKKDAQTFRDEARKEGKIPILSHKLTSIRILRDAFLKQLGEAGLREQFDAALPEVVVLYDDGPVRCRAMLDKVLINETTKRATIFDVKSTDSANPSGLGRLIFNQDYDMQCVSYIHALECVRPELAGRIDFIFFFIEAAFPFCLTPAQLNGESAMLGTSKWYRAHAAWERCLRTGFWPAYGTEIVRVEPPAWGLNAEMGAS